MAERGEITEWDPAEGWGTLRVDSGVEMRFKHNACEDGVTCAVGASVFVQEHLPYLGKQRRATSISATAEAAGFASELPRAPVPAFDAGPFERVPHIDRVLAQLGIAIDTSMLAVGEEPLGVIYAPEQIVAWTPFDPCFIAFGGMDGDAWGALCHPALLARGEAPIVKWSHDGAPIRFEAATFAEWAARRVEETDGESDHDAYFEPVHGPTTALAEAVRAIVDGLPPASAEERAALEAYLASIASEPDQQLARLDALIAVYRALGWPRTLIERAEVQRASIVAEAAHYAAYAKSSPTR